MSFNIYSLYHPKHRAKSQFVKIWDEPINVVWTERVVLWQCQNVRGRVLGEPKRGLTPDHVSHCLFRAWLSTWSQAQGTGVKTAVGQEPSVCVHSDWPQACLFHLLSLFLSCWLPSLTTQTSSSQDIFLNLPSGLPEHYDSFCAPQGQGWVPSVSQDRRAANTPSNPACW